METPIYDMGGLMRDESVKLKYPTPHHIHGAPHLGAQWNRIHVMEMRELSTLNMNRDGVGIHSMELKGYVYELPDLWSFNLYGICSMELKVKQAGLMKEERIYSMGLRVLCVLPWGLCLGSSCV
jgi:hypothetical protein